MYHTHSWLQHKPVIQACSPVTSSTQWPVLLSANCPWTHSRARDGWLFPHPNLPTHHATSLPAHTFKYRELGTGVDLAHTIGGGALIDGLIPLHPQWLDPQHRPCAIIKLDYLSENRHVVTACWGHGGLLRVDLLIPPKDPQGGRLRRAGVGPN